MTSASTFLTAAALPLHAGPAPTASAPSEARARTARAAAPAASTAPEAPPVAVPSFGLAPALADGPAGRLPADSAAARTLGPLSAVASPDAESPQADPADPTARVLFDGADSVLRSPYASASEVFGAASTLAPAASVPPPVRPASPALETALFQGSVLLLAACYAAFFYRALGDIRALLERVFRKASSKQSLLEDSGSNGFLHFLHRAGLLGTLLIGALVLKFGRALIPAPLAELAPSASVLLLGLAALLVWRMLTLCQTGVLQLAGALTLNGPLVAHLVLLRRIYFALAVLLAAPAALLVVFCPPQAEAAWLSLAAGASAVAAVLYVRETLRLFLSRKISILHWFLYLCGVELFPVSLLWLLATR